MGQTGLLLFAKVDLSRVTGTGEVPVVVLVPAFKNTTKPVWPISEVASVRRNACAKKLKFYDPGKLGVCISRCLGLSCYTHSKFHVIS